MSQITMTPEVSDCPPELPCRLTRKLKLGVFAGGSSLKVKAAKIRKQHEWRNLTLKAIKLLNATRPTISSLANKPFHKSRPTVTRWPAFTFNFCQDPQGFLSQRRLRFCTVNRLDRSLFILHFTQATPTWQAIEFHANSQPKKRAPWPYVSDPTHNSSVHVPIMAHKNISQDRVIKFLTFKMPSRVILNVLISTHWEGGGQIFSRSGLGIEGKIAIVFHDWFDLCSKIHRCCLVPRLSCV